MYHSIFDGVFFIEGDPAGSKIINAISSKHDGAFSQSQLKSLDTLKKEMARRVKAEGGNAVVNFTYGQKNTFWRSLLSIDDVWWFASGSIAIVDPQIFLRSEGVQAPAASLTGAQGGGASASLANT